MIADLLREILTSTMSGVLTVIVTSLLVAMVYALYFEMQRSKFMKDIRRFKTPAKRILCSEELPHTFNVSEKSAFVPLLNEQEQKIILEQDAKGKNLFNGKAVRLDSLIDGEAVLSEVGFFDFMTTNLVVKPNSRTKKSAFSNLYAAIFSDQIRYASKLEHRIKAAVLGQSKKTFDDVLAIRELANIVTVSVLLQDSTGRVLVVKRGNKVAISSGNFATACAGSVDDRDLTNDNPFLSCAQRELQEELGIKCDLKFDNLIISKQKLQPAALFSGRLDCTFESLYQDMLKAPDFKEENSTLFAVPDNKISGIVKKYQFTDVAAFQLAGRTKSWFTVIPQSIAPYKLS